MALGKKEKLDKAMVEDLVIDSNLDSLMDGKCPDCGGDKFSGGKGNSLSEIIECTGCTSRFAVTFMNGKIIFAERTPSR